ncbi:cobyric acid synthase [Homoserinibacter sp. YIM 151385]|uniref:cobyric acid synthase n=1 Tax=Homoserinibacter sp. YIM 151385 TaxID=2985506 RepID=UPI0022F05693|nr:cobyric acid synthase [Homoserinibacter sp. YIM 151385]WBU38492.1 cobyric acid synthase [Homoserinibacter sp. YIM 151385]
MTHRILSLYPELLDVNGDAQNALVLAQRARWSGVDAVVQPLALGEPAPAAPAVLVVGSSVDAALPALAASLAGIGDALRGWVSDGVPILAVGTGFELLAEAIEPAPGSRIRGFGLFGGIARPLPSRATDDLVVDAAGFRLAGFENHARGIVGSEDAPLGRVVHGTGDGGGREGARSGSAIGTRLHGPVLAKNPGLADELLAAAGIAVDAASPRIEAADALAQGARDRILAAVGLRG